jgi:hypothetical protein
MQCLFAGKNSKLNKNRILSLKTRRKKEINPENMK